MFPLQARTLPTTAHALAAALNETVRSIVVTASDPVSVRDKAYPALEEIAVSLDHATLREDAPRPALGETPGKPAVTVDRLSVSGKQISAGPARISLSLTAEDVRLNQRSDPAGCIVLDVQSAANGNMEVAIAKDELEAAIANVAKSEAGKHGVNIDDVRLTLSSLGPRSVRAQVQLRARKLFLSASIVIAGQLDVDDQLEAKISDLACSGDGAIATLACGVLSPQLAKINDRSFSLLALPLGNVRLKDVRINVTDMLTVAAQFGTQAS